MNLVHLPVSSRTIFFANLMAVLFLVGLVAVDVNAASCVLFPMVVAAAQSRFLFFVKFAAGACGRSFAGERVRVLRGVLDTGAADGGAASRAFRRVSAYIRGVVVVYLVALLCTSSAVPEHCCRAGRLRYGRF